LAENTVLLNPHPHSLKLKVFKHGRDGRILEKKGREELRKAEKTGVKNYSGVRRNREADEELRES